MSWRDLLSKPVESVYPWTGGRELQMQGRHFVLTGRLPVEHGWNVFTTSGNKDATWSHPADDLAVVSACEGLSTFRGYLVGDHLVTDDITRPPDAKTAVDLLMGCETVRLIPPGLGRFCRVSAVRWEDGRLIFLREEFPLGPEGEVQAAFEERRESLSEIKSVVPSLDLAFQVESWSRKEVERARAEAERRAREEAARLEAEAKRKELATQLSTGAGRRAMATMDFETAARAALEISGSELLDWHQSRVANEAVVQFRFRGERYECVCRMDTLGIIDSGICLGHGAARGDRLFVLEALPGVIAEAIRGRKLVRYRHVELNRHHGRDYDPEAGYDDGAEGGWR